MKSATSKAPKTSKNILFYCSGQRENSHEKEPVRENKYTNVHGNESYSGARAGSGSDSMRFKTNYQVF